jgi:O-antigen/teichoic acid export membrane protein
MRGWPNNGSASVSRHIRLAKYFLLAIVVVLGLVCWLRDNHALAYGMIAASCVTITFSYTMSSYRPWFSFAKVRELWSVSQWFMVDHGSQFIGRRVDEFVIGRHFRLGDGWQLLHGVGNRDHAGARGRRAERPRLDPDLCEGRT